MAPKRVTTVIKMQVPAGQASPASVGSSLGPHGVSSPQFCQQFNSATQNNEPGLLIPVVISVYADRSFSFITKTPPAAVLIKRALDLDKGSALPHKEKVAQLPKAKLLEIAQVKLPDLNAHDEEAAMKIVAGTARSMGVTIEA